MRSIGLLVALAIGALLLFQGVSNYNNFQVKQIDLEEAWGRVQSAYQQRADLIPNLVSTVKGAAEFEKGTFTALTEARAKATSINVDISNPGDLENFQKAQGALSSGLGRLLAVMENYPQLQATAGFRDLQAQLEGQENRIRVERNKFNEEVADFNKAVKVFPASFFATMFGFSEKPQFEADQTAQNAPKVEF